VTVHPIVRSRITCTRISSVIVALAMCVSRLNWESTRPDVGAAIKFHGAFSSLVLDVDLWKLSQRHVCPRFGRNVVRATIVDID